MLLSRTDYNQMFKEGQIKRKVERSKASTVGTGHESKSKYR